MFKILFLIFMATFALARDLDTLDLNNADLSFDEFLADSFNFAITLIMFIFIFSPLWGCLFFAKFGKKDIVFDKENIWNNKIEHHFFIKQYFKHYTIWLVMFFIIISLMYSAALLGFYSGKFDAEAKYYLILFYFFLIFMAATTGANLFGAHFRSNYTDFKDRIFITSKEMVLFKFNKENKEEFSFEKGRFNAKILPFTKGKIEHFGFPAVGFTLILDDGRQKVEVEIFVTLYYFNKEKALMKSEFFNEFFNHLKNYARSINHKSYSNAQECVKDITEWEYKSVLKDFLDKLPFKRN